MALLCCGGILMVWFVSTHSLRGKVHYKSIHSHSDWSASKHFPILRLQGLTEQLNEYKSNVNHTLCPSQSPDLNPPEHFGYCSIVLDSSILIWLIWYDWYDIWLIWYDIWYIHTQLYNCKHLYSWSWESLNSRKVIGLKCCVVRKVF